LFERNLISYNYNKWTFNVNCDLTCYFDNFEIILLLECLDHIIENKDLALDNINSEEEACLWKDKILIRLGLFYKVFIEELIEITQ